MECMESHRSLQEVESVSPRQMRYVAHVLARPWGETACSPSLEEVCHHFVIPAVENGISQVSMYGVSEPHDYALVSEIETTKTDFQEREEVPLRCQDLGSSCILQYTIHTPSPAKDQGGCPIWLIR